METVGNLKSLKSKASRQDVLPPFSTLPGEKGRSAWLCSGYLGICPLSTAFINYEKSAQNILLFFIILWLYLELLTGQNRWLVLREMKYQSVFLHIQKSISVIKVPIRLFPKTAMSSCNVRSADEGSLTLQISLTQLCSQEPSDSVGC